MDLLSPLLCPCCDRQYDDKTSDEETNRVQYYHHSQHEMCVTENKRPIATYIISMAGIKAREVYDSVE